GRGSQGPPHRCTHPLDYFINAVRSQTFPINFSTINPAEIYSLGPQTLSNTSSYCFDDCGTGEGAQTLPNYFSSMMSRNYECIRHLGLTLTQIFDGYSNYMPGSLNSVISRILDILDYLYNKVYLFFDILTKFDANSGIFDIFGNLDEYLDILNYFWPGIAP